MLGSIALYFAVLSFLVPADPPTANSELFRMLRKAFFMVAIAETFAVWVIHRRLLAPSIESPVRPASDALEPGRALTVHVFCWALGESIAIYGLVLGLVGHRIGPASFFFAWGVAVLLLLRPRAELFA